MLPYNPERSLNRHTRIHSKLKAMRADENRHSTGDIEMQSTESSITSMTTNPLQNIDHSDPESQIVPPPEEVPSTYSIALEILKVSAPILLVEYAKVFINFFNSSLFSSFTPEEDYSAASGYIFPMVVGYIVALSAFVFIIAPILKDQESKKEENAQNAIDAQRNIIFYSLFISMFVGSIVAIPAYFTGDIFIAAHASPELSHIVGKFFHRFAFALPVIYCSLALQQMLIAVGLKNWLYSGSVITVTTAVLWSYATTQWAPEIIDLSNIEAIALSYLIGYGVSVAYYLTGLYINNLLTLPVANDINFSSTRNSLYKFGSPIVAQITSELAAVNALPIAALFMDDTTSALARLNLILNYNLFTVVFAIAIGIGVSLLLSDLKNAQKYHSIKAYGNTALLLAGLWNGAWFVAGLAIPTLLASAFVKQADIAGNGINGKPRSLLTIDFAGLFLNSWRDVLSGTFRPFYITKTPTTASYLTLWGIGIPLGLALCFGAGLNVAGLELGYYSGTAIGGIYLYAIWANISNLQVIKEICASENRQQAADSFKGQLESLGTSAYKLYQAAKEACGHNTLRLEGPK